MMERYGRFVMSPIRFSDLEGREKLLEFRREKNNDRREG